MKKFIPSITVACLATLLPTAAFAQAIIVSQDGTFLGYVDSNSYSSGSICNEYGKFGSPYNDSIFNKYGRHGGEYSQTGAYNRNARRPPILLVDNQIIGFVTKNPNFQNRIDPDILKIKACEN